MHGEYLGEVRFCISRTATTLTAFGAMVMLSAAGAFACASSTGPGARRPAVPETCAFVRMEQREAEADLIDTDSIFVTLVYTPPGQVGRARPDPVSTTVQVKRERVGNLRAHLQARPELLCEPDRDAPGGYRVQPPL